MGTLWNVRIDLSRLQANLSRANRLAFTTDDTRRWLDVMGFRREGESWVVDDDDIARLGADEIIAKSEIRADEPVAGASD